MLEFHPLRTRRRHVEVTTGVKPINISCLSELIRLKKGLGLVCGQGRRTCFMVTSERAKAPRRTAEQKSDMGGGNGRTVWYIALGIEGAVKVRTLDSYRRCKPSYTIYTVCINASVNICVQSYFFGAHDQSRRNHLSYIDFLHRHQIEFDYVV